MLMRPAIVAVSELAKVFRGEPLHSSLPTSGRTDAVVALEQAAGHIHPPAIRQMCMTSAVVTCRVDVERGHLVAVVPAQAGASPTVTTVPPALTVKTPLIRPSPLILPLSTSVPA